MTHHLNLLSQRHMAEINKLMVLCSPSRFITIEVEIGIENQSSRVLELANQIRILNRQRQQLEEEREPETPLSPDFDDLLNPQWAVDRTVSTKHRKPTRRDSSSSRNRGRSSSFRMLHSIPERNSKEKAVTANK